MTEPRSSRRGDGVTVALFSLAGLFAVAAMLGSQLRGAHAESSAPRPVLVRRIYRTTVDERVIGARRPGRSSTSSESSMSAPLGDASLPATRTS